MLVVGGSGVNNPEQPGLELFTAEQSNICKQEIWAVWARIIFCFTGTESNCYVHERFLVHLFQAFVKTTNW